MSRQKNEHNTILPYNFIKTYNLPIVFDKKHPLGQYIQSSGGTPTNEKEIIARCGEGFPDVEILLFVIYSLAKFGT